MVETNLRFQPNIKKLNRLLKEKHCQHYLINLWSWGVDSNCVSGIIDLEAEEVAQICGYIGDSGTFMDALIECEWLIPQKDGTHYMRGWSRTKGYFDQKKRMRINMKVKRLMEKGVPKEKAVAIASED